MCEGLAVTNTEGAQKKSDNCKVPSKPLLPRSMMTRIAILQMTEGVVKGAEDGVVEVEEATLYVTQAQGTASGFYQWVDE